MPEPECQNPFTSQKIVSGTSVGPRFEVGVGHSLLSLTPAVSLETYKLPDSDEEVAEEEAIRRVLKQVRSGSCGLVCHFLSCSLCVCYPVSVQRMCFSSWAKVHSFPS